MVACDCTTRLPGNHLSLSMLFMDMHEVVGMQLLAWLAALA